MTFQQWGIAIINSLGFFLAAYLGSRNVSWALAGLCASLIVFFLGYVYGIVSYFLAFKKERNE